MIAGRLVPGDPAPAVRALAKQVGCSPGTAARALTVLREAGVIMSRLLRDAGVTPRPDGEPCESHLGVAVAVATGAADAGLAIRAAAEAVDVDFLPVEWEDFELAGRLRWRVRCRCSRICRFDVASPRAGDLDRVTFDPALSAVLPRQDADSVVRRG